MVPDAIRETSKARSRYECALAELDAARENLSSAVGRHSFAECSELRADLEHLVRFDPHERDTPVRIAAQPTTCETSSRSAWLPPQAGTAKDIALV